MKFLVPTALHRTACGVLSSLGLAAVGAASASDSIVPERDIAPILRAYCAGCHNDTDHEGKLSVETFAKLRHGGEEGDPIVPGKPDDSLLQQLIEGREKPKMPPKDEPQPPPESILLLRQWIAAGAPTPAVDESILQTLIVPELAAPNARITPISSAAYSPDGSLLAISKGRNIQVQQSDSGAVIMTFSGLPGPVNAVHFSPDGKMLIAATGIVGMRGAAWLYQIESGTKIREFGHHTDVLYDAEFSPDGAVLATAGYDRVIRLWNVADGKEHRAIDIHKGAIFDLAWHPSGKILASASSDETVKLWRVSDGVRLDTLNQPVGSQNAVLFSPDGNYVAAAGADKRIYLWRLVSRDAPALNPLLHARFAHEAPIVSLALSGDGKNLLSSAEDGLLKVWRLPEVVEIQALERQPDIATAVAARPGTASVFAGRMDGSTAILSINPSNTHPQTAAKAPTTSLPPNPGEERQLNESEPNDQPNQAAAVDLPAEIKGVIGRPGDLDCFKFHAEAGQRIMLLVVAAAAKSKLDSKLEVLTARGEPIEQAVLQATRDSWLTFRGKNSEAADDFRLQRWEQMELDEFLYCNGEVVRLWHYPRGPDSGFLVYPGAGTRHTFFHTTAQAHALGQPCYTVAVLPPGTQPIPNGLPVFRLHYENDDDPLRASGRDSRLLFTAPTAGDFVARISDVRNFGGERDFHFTLSVRPPRPDFTASISPREMSVSPGSGREFTVSVNRTEGFEGPVKIELSGLAPGFSSSCPITVEAGQNQASGVIFASADAKAPDEAAQKAANFTATTEIDGKPLTKPLGNVTKLTLGPPAKLLVQILSANAPQDSEPRFEIRPGQTITARVRVERRGFNGRVEFGNEFSGRNMPHGVYVDNIGLNGLLIVEGQDERDFQITASPITAPGERYIHLTAKDDGGQAARPVLLRVVK